MIYFIHGPDRLLAREAARVTATEYDPDGANTSWLDGRETSLERLLAAIGTVSFFGGARVVVVSDLLGRGGREPGPGEPDDATARSTRAQAHPVLTPLAESVPPDHCLILLEPSLTAPPAALKSAIPTAHIIAAEPPRGGALIHWITDTAARANAEIDRQAAQALAATLFPQTWDRGPNNPRYDRPPDLALLAQEIEKLALYALPGPIETHHVAELVIGGPDQRVFRFLDAALAGDVRTAVGELERLEAAGEEPAMLLAQILGQIELSAVTAEAGDRNAATVARDAGSVTASRVSAVMSSTRRQPVRSTSTIEIGVKADRALKTGRTRRPDVALHDLMLDLVDSVARKTGRST